ncbi:septal ring lytic transglycosylase RlpA family protein [Methylopila sp. 73B]|uniref:septal ring lytic transglycosylase RlpA family protein n=1 Tax=Methylopila sp. 73B TaxID=1120792 RepID=UPI000372643F|nr:septal ring lytic transglycosylase RlpA family protein [Methylopila sp. 73B]
MNDAATVTRAQNRRSVVPFAFRFPQVAVVVACAALAACSAQTQSTKTAAVAPTVDPVLGVAASPQVVAAGQPAPKGGGVYSVGKTYQVAGKVYSPATRKPGPVGVGLASFYGARFHGRRTANGEVFDSASLSAAHPSLPLPSYVRVTNVTNGRSVVVRVNDRGPFHKGRLIDVSQRTADVLGFRRAGVGAVKIDYVGLAPLAGADDRQLLATYKEFGRPAAPEGVQLASLKPVSDAELLGRAAPSAGFTVVASAEAPAPKVETNLTTAYAPAQAAAPLPMPAAKPEPRMAAAPRVAPEPKAGLADAKPLDGKAPESRADVRLAATTAEPAPAVRTSAPKVVAKRVVKPTEEPVLAAVAPQLAGAETPDEPAPVLRPAQNPAVAARIAASFEGFGDTPAFVRSQEPNLGAASAYSNLR